ncbi:Predicted arabinose efflux permease, MFS family [Haloechinothrix alba]|uniref:Predicted arabinose efflux permease, MFS family n=1 Tax=Haloechinothrix alba TaxID=664784 RepID=A0A238Y284_9PSEU|nr:MFS transporter [Haloechinothrix alba]SNR65237.1 Predicted arabinose efflux permease, MFS family [Haloechinothrix alba]
MPRSEATRRWAFALVSVSGVMLTLDVTVINVALPAIGAQLQAGPDVLPWTVSAYSLAFGTLLLTAGTWSDAAGHRTVFAVGMAVFTLASLGCATAPTIGVLIGARAVQGAGGALAFAPAIALLATTHNGRSRSSAMASFAALSSLAGALGPVIGGGVVAALDWQWIFLVNVPVGAFVVLATVATLPPGARPSGPRRTDVSGTALGVATLLALHAALTTGSSLGWTSLPTVAASGLLCVLLPAFARSQRRPDAMFDVGAGDRAAFAGAATLMFTGRMVSLGTLVYLTLWLQETVASSPLHTGILLLPLTGSLAVAGTMVSAAQARLGPATVVAGGFVLQGSGLSTTAIAASAGGLPLSCAGMALLGAGTALIFPPLLTVTVTVVPSERTGMASGLTNACSPLGTATGVAAFGALFTALDGSGAGTALTGVCLAATTICLAGAVLAHRLLPAELPGQHAPDQPDDRRRSSQIR